MSAHALALVLSVLALLAVLASVVLVLQALRRLSPAPATPDSEKVPVEPGREHSRRHGAEQAAGMSVDPGGRRSGAQDGAPAAAEPVTAAPLAGRRYPAAEGGTPGAATVGTAAAGPTGDAPGVDGHRAGSAAAAASWVDGRAERVAIERRQGELARLGDDLERRELRLAERESRLDVEARQLEARAAELAEHDEELDRRRAELAELDAERRTVLAQAAGLSVDEARAQLMARLEHEAKLAAAHTVREIERSAVDEGESRARAILTTAIQRLAAQQTADATVTALALPSDEMKGRIIGREGRNVRAFEAVTGVNLIIDETPGTVLVSCFDPVRREVARLTLQDLVADGRIHPGRIEEVHQRHVAEVGRLCLRAGQDAVTELGITDLDPELVHVLGQLRYRTSYGQNVLGHLKECAHLAALMAAEIGLDATVCSRAALLHDIGKALTHQSTDSHALVGAELARRHGESDDVVHAIEAHHNEVEPRTVEAVLVQAADAISGSRPGARRESLEAYVQRLEALERIARSRPGVHKVFAMQAGREVRVMVLPHEVDDIQAQVLARDIAKQVEQELTYPGQIKVTVVRESRTTEVAR